MSFILEAHETGSAALRTAPRRPFLSEEETHDTRTVRRLPRLRGRDKGGGDTGDGALLRHAQEMVEAAIANLRLMARTIGCIIVQPELNCTSLRNMGFAFMLTADEVIAEMDRLPDFRAEVVLMINFGSDVTPAVNLTKTLDMNPEFPTLISVLVVPNAECRTFREVDTSLPSPPPKDLPRAGFEVGQKLAEARAALFSAGADDVVCLYAGESLQPYRVMEILDKLEFLTEKMREIVVREVEVEKASWMKKLQQAFKTFLTSLPGRALPELPKENASLIEEQNQNGELIGLGEYSFRSKLGAGSFGSVFQAQHPTRELCAVKVMLKDHLLRGASPLFNVAREACIGEHLPKHANIVPVLEVLHSRHTLSLVMGFAGSENLHRFTRAMLNSTGDATLPASVAKSFRRQQATAVAHLHHYRVCHRDLKPSNWVVDDGGTALQLTDFGLAAHVISEEQPLFETCGSLPFVAPEVFGSCGTENKEKGAGSGTGYNGLAADIWSLGVNHMELQLGPFGVEKLLAWCPKIPPSRSEQLQGLSALPERWACVLREDHGLRKGDAVSRMVVLESRERWRIEQVTGTTKGPA